MDPETLALSHVADQVLERSRPAARAHRPRGLPGGARGALRPVRHRWERRSTELARGPAAARGRRRDADRRRPPSRRRLFDVELVQSERYGRVERQMRGLIKRTPECALHVHVGLPDTDAAVAAMNGLRELLPLLHGLGANSPFWFGADSGMASSRAAVIRAYPGRGIPPVLDSWDDYLAALDAVRAGGGPTDHTMVWWDARPQPRLGTVELREVDVQSDLESAGAHRGAWARDRAARRGGAAQVNCAGAGAALVELPGRARRARRRDLLRRRPAAAARGGRAACWPSWRAPTPSSRALRKSSAKATARPGSAPRMSAAACRACSVTSRT